MNTYFLREITDVNLLHQLVKFIKSVSPVYNDGSRRYARLNFGGRETLRGRLVEFLWHHKTDRALIGSIRVTRFIPRDIRSAVEQCINTCELTEKWSPFKYKHAIVCAMYCIIRVYYYFFSPRITLETTLYVRDH